MNAPFKNIGQAPDQVITEAKIRPTPVSLTGRAMLFLRANGDTLVWTAILFVGALLVRWPHLLLIPRFSDEGLEALWGWSIARSRFLPLTAVDPYDGPLFAYLVAALIKVLGSSILIPRLMVTVFGALTVPLTYYLGRSMWNSRAGLIAAAFVLTAPKLVIPGHVGISNGLTPFFCTLTLILLWNGVVRNRPWSLAGSGLFAAFALQSHPLVIFQLVGMGIWFLLRRDLRARLHHAAPYYAVGLFVLGYLPMLIANMRPNSPMFEMAPHRGYAFGPTVNLVEYGSRLMGLAWQIAIRLQVGLDSAWAQLLGGGFSILAVLGLFLAWRQGKSLPAAVILATLGLFPIIIKSVQPRYIADLIPVCSVAAGIALTQGWEVLSRARTNSRLRRGSVLICALAGILILPAAQLAEISRSYATAVAQGQTNEELFRLSETVQKAGACGERLFVENVGYRLDGFPTYYTSQSIDYVLTFQNCGHHFYRISDLSAHVAELDNQDWLILKESSWQAISKQVSLMPVMTVNLYRDRKAQTMTLFRVQTLLR